MACTQHGRRLLLCTRRSIHNPSRTLQANSSSATALAHPARVKHSVRERHFTSSHRVNFSTMPTNTSATTHNATYVIVGAGSAGCVLANRLSADPQNKVILLEAGGKDDYIWIHVPMGYLFTMNNPRTCWCFQTTPQEGLNNRVIQYPRGRVSYHHCVQGSRHNILFYLKTMLLVSLLLCTQVIGGCSSINGMVYQRGNKGNYDGWAQDNPGCAGVRHCVVCTHIAPLGSHNVVVCIRWDWDSVFPIFKRNMDYAPGETSDCGVGGRWRVERQRAS